VGAVQTKAHRESILYSGAVVPSHLKQLMELLNEVVTQPLITSKDLKEMQAVIGYELDELKAKPDDLLPELAHGPAFYSSHAKQIDDTMFMDWNSIVGIPQDLQHVTVESVMEYWRTMYTSQNMIVVGAGLPHGELYNAAMDTFGKIEKTPLPEERNLDLGYVGGNQYIENDELPLVHMCVGFEGAKASSEQTYSMAILQMLMGGGSSFSAGGPGKGMYSRLYTQVLNRYHWIDSCKIFNFSYPTSGMFGIHGSALPSHSRDLAQLLLNQLHGMTLPLTNIEVERAKNQVKSAVLMGLESRLVELEDLGDQICNLKKYVSPNEICERIDAVSAEELRRTAITVLNSKPTVVAYGPLHRMPPYDMILKWHHAALKHDL
jgi:processing peptidase subunit alpha